MSPCLSDGRVTLCRPPAEQPLTRWRDVIVLGGFGEGPIRRKVFRHRVHPRRQIRCHKCRRRRWARNLVVIAGAGWYDPLIFCAGRCPPRRRAAKKP